MAQFERGISVELIAACFEYDRDTGRIFWKVDCGGKNGGKRGDEAALKSHKKPYRRVTLFGKTFQAHRVALALANGEWPSGHVDHINGDKSDNRLGNLRVATRSQNQANRGPDRGSQSGMKGVDWMRGKMRWRARIGKDHIGTFHTREDAARAYDREAVARYGEFARTNFKMEKCNG